MRVACLLIAALLVFGLPAGAASNWKNLKQDETGTPDRAWKGGNGLFEIQGVLGGATVNLQRKLAPVGDYQDVTPITTRDGAADCDLTADGEFCWFVAPGDSQIHPVVVGGDGTTDITVMVSGADQAAAAPGGGLAAGDPFIEGDVTFVKAGDLVTGNLSFDDITDTLATDLIEANRLTLPIVDTPATPPLSFGVGNGIYSSQDGNLSFSVSDQRVWLLTASSFLWTTLSGPQLRGLAPSGTVPTLIPNRDSQTTGVGARSAGELSLTTGAVEAVFIDDAQLTAHVGNIGADPTATCEPGAIWIDTDETVDTNCTTTNDNALCCCISANNWVPCANG